MGNKFFNTLILGFVGLVIPCAGITAITGWGIFNWFTTSPELVDIQVTGANVVSVGETFFVDFDIENLADQPQTLDSIDWDYTLLNGIHILSSNPVSDGINEYSNFRSYYFNRPIASGEEFQVRFEASGKEPGEFIGGISVCINTASSCETYEVTLTVEN